MDKIELIRNTSIFKSLQQDLLITLAEYINLFEVPESVEILSEGHPSTAFFILKSGRVNVSITEGDTRVSLAVLDAGSHFGEMSLITGDPASATITTLSDCEVYILQKEDFDQVLKMSPELYLDLSLSLCRRLNSTNAELKKSASELKSLNKNLEKIVEERTKDLKKRNKEVRDILDNIKQSIITVKNDGIVSEEYSLFSESVFETNIISNLKFVDLLYTDRDNDKKEKWNSFINRVFNNESIDWNNIDDIIPEKEIMYIFTLSSGSKDLKFLNIHLEPIFMDNTKRLDKLMVITSDITLTKRLEEEIAQKDEELKESIEEMAGIVNIDLEAFDDYLVEAKDILYKFEDYMFNKQDELKKHDVLSELCIIAHTLKGNSRMFDLTKLVDTVHELEEHLIVLRDNVDELEESDWMDYLEALKQGVSEIGKQLNKAEIYISTLTKKQEEKTETKIADVEHVKRPSELTIKVKHERIVRLEEKLRKLANKVKADDLGVIFDSIKEMRKVKAYELFKRFGKLVNDLSYELKKPAKLEIVGGETEIDRLILDKLQDPLVHVIRNSLDHGIETQSQRFKKKKEKEALIRLSAEKQNGNVIIIIEDDGKGLDPQVIRNSAIEKEILSEAEAIKMTDTEVFSLLFRQGFSTKKTVSDISGRGIGLDAIRDAVSEINGDIVINGKVNQGTIVRITIPEK